MIKLARNDKTYGLFDMSESGLESVYEMDGQIREESNRVRQADLPSRGQSEDRLFHCSIYHSLHLAKCLVVSSVAKSLSFGTKLSAPVNLFAKLVFPAFVYLKS